MHDLDMNIPFLWSLKSSGWKKEKYIALLFVIYSFIQISQIQTCYQLALSDLNHFCAQVTSPRSQSFNVMSYATGN